MALGALIVRLGLDAADFISGLSKSEQQAKKFGSTLDRSIVVGVIKAQVALEALGAAARATGQIFQSLTTGAAQFKDLEETTGAAAESIASLAVSAAVAGVDINDVAAAANKLTKNLVGVDDESKAAGAALKALNLNIDDFKKLDPVAQYEAVGKALGGYADGAAKVAVAQALFGKSGAEQLKVFKALEEAGGRQTILTQRQIELSDQYADQQSKTTAELRLYAQAAASEAVPAIADLTRVAADVAREFLGVDAATGKLAANNGAKAFAESAADALAFAADKADLFVRLFQLAGKTIAGTAGIYSAVARGEFAQARAIGLEAQADLERVIARATFADRLAKQRVASLNSAFGSESTELARRGRGPKTLPVLNFEGAQAAAKTSSAVVKGVKEETAAMKEAMRVAKERADFRNRDYEAAVEGARANEQADRDRVRAIIDQTQSAKVASVTKDIELLNAAFADEISAGNAEKWAEAILVATSKLGSGGKAEIDEMSEFAAQAARNIQDKLGDSLEAAMSGNFKSIGDLWKNTLNRMAAQAAAAQLNKYLFGADFGSSGNLGGIIGLGLNAASAYFGGGAATNTTGTNLPTSGGRAIGGPTMPNSVYPISENRPEVYSDGSRSWLITGSQRGNVDPNPRLSGGRTINAPIYINVPGNTSRQTAEQIGAEVSRALAVSNARNN